MLTNLDGSDPSVPQQKFSQACGFGSAKEDSKRIFFADAGFLFCAGILEVNSGTRSLRKLPCSQNGKREPGEEFENDKDNV